MASVKLHNLSSFPLPEIGYDETLAPNGEVKSEWQTLLQNLAHLGENDLVQRNQDLQRVLRENGVTYNVYEGHLATARNWNLDPVPWVLNGQDWLKVEKGLKQRAELLNFIFKDLYGPKKLLKAGLIPHELIFCHRGFLRPCDGISHATDYPLALYATDVARGPEGQMWVINDKTQAPSGMGYALENRTAMKRVLPEMYKAQPVRKISDFFNFYYQSLCQLAPKGKENPRIALLTPGEKNETYFEHAFLADYLGINLVQGYDLLVKDSCVWIKTIHGLEQIDILVRRVDDIFCDPLEFRSDSQLGVPGLLEAIRQGNVAMANPLGSGVLENSGLMPFLNNISKIYFGQDLILPTVATWWCGQAKELHYVLSHFGELIIKKIDRYSGSPTFMPSSMSRAERERLIKHIKHEPYLYVGQEKISFSTVPSLIGDVIEPRFSVLRSFAVADSSGYHIMPGGLTRTSPEKGNFIVSNQAGGASKDTWVLEESESSNHSVKITLSKPPKNYQRESLTSRMAENLFWAGRYSERVLATLRVMKTTLRYILENPTQEPFQMVKDRLLCSLTHLTMSYPGFLGDEKNPPCLPHPHLFELAQDENLVGGLAFNTRNLIQAMQSVGGYLSNDTRRMVESLKDNALSIKKMKSTSFLSLSNALDKLYNALVSLLGFITESMPREQGWLMFQSGRKIERSSLIASLARATLVYKDHDFVQQQVLEAVLRSNQLISTYRYKYRTHLNLEYALQLLLFDENNPRSIAYQLQKLMIYLRNLTSDKEDAAFGKDQKLVLEAHTKLVLTDSAELLQEKSDDLIRKKLDALLADFTDLMIQCSIAINQKYFSHSSEMKNLILTAKE